MSWNASDHSSRTAHALLEYEQAKGVVYGRFRSGPLGRVTQLIALGGKIKTITILIAAVLLLAGCASPPGLSVAASDATTSDEAFTLPMRARLIRTNPFFASLVKPVRLFAMVYVDDGKVVIDQEPIHVHANEGVNQKVKITWTLGDSGYFFPDDQSVTITVQSGPPPISVDCFRAGQPPAISFICRIMRPARPAKYSYSITVSDGTTLYHGDPYIASD